MEAYLAKKAEYDQKMEEHAHIDFSALTFVPEVKELSYYIELKKEQKKSNPRFKRTQALLRARAVDGGAGGFDCVDNPEADVVSAFSTQRINTGSQASDRSALGRSATGQSAAGRSRRQDSEMQMEGGEED